MKATMNFDIHPYADETTMGSHLVTEHVAYQRGEPFARSRDPTAILHNHGSAWGDLPKLSERAESDVGSPSTEPTKPFSIC